MILMRIEREILKRDKNIKYILRNEANVVKAIREGYKPTNKEECRKECEVVEKWTVSVAIKNKKGETVFCLFHGKPDPIKILEMAEEEKCEMNLSIWDIGIYQAYVSGEILIYTTDEQEDRILEKLKEIGGLEWS